MFYCIGCKWWNKVTENFHKILVLFVSNLMKLQNVTFPSFFYTLFFKVAQCLHHQKSHNCWKCIFFASFYSSNANCIGYLINIYSMVLKHNMNGIDDVINSVKFDIKHFKREDFFVLFTPNGNLSKTSYLIFFCFCFLEKKTSKRVN